MKTLLIYYCVTLIVLTDQFDRISCDGLAIAFQGR